MNSIDTEKARVVLEDLRLQAKQAQEQFVLLKGAVQGVEAILRLGEEDVLPEPEIAEPQNSPLNLAKKTSRGKK